ncbi:GNAT family N-acetyltransferase [Siansivirga zeaxanthinifaciens]|uniref:GNAT family acetyltransferase n=1 Tax=Siansivirga zeaxanthinifaciens CC-SAMT-1 TaxID=1454006 RepID=A0A0C5WF30_9FLAO|nr:GNAT family N-acetyltransferase [Siansivirga zeaxanthinifaciens]AJR03819.1 GNAT family acetyltransferase [Siansivirga zeaxanthinifaciens CC-SAMT-1]
MKIKTFDAYSRLSHMDINRLTQFIYDHSGDYRDRKSAIKKSLLYAMKDLPGLGGYVFVMETKEDILGALVVNKTGMNEYIPENILVYLSVNKDYRGQGIAKKLIDYTLKYCKGDISLFINKNNEVLKFFESNGFKSRNIEMRLTRSSI